METKLVILRPKKILKEVLLNSLNYSEYLPAGSKKISDLIMQVSGERVAVSSITTMMKSLCAEGFIESIKVGKFRRYRLIKIAERA